MARIRYYLYRIRHPEIFQGGDRKKDYFEGWYYKILDRDAGNVLVIIPGVSLDKTGRDSHAFIQIMDSNHQVYYIRYSLTDFSFHERAFHIRIGDSYFAKDYMSLRIDDERIHMRGRLSFSNIIDLPRSILRPGIMGPFAYLPLMECNHGIVNIQHDISGFIMVSGRTIDFTGGRGYIEKDWGRSFPKNWVWLQSNHFKEGNVTIMFSMARVPILGIGIPGFISFLRIGKHVHVFATYTGARIRKYEYRGSILNIVVEDRSYRLNIRVKNNDGGILKAPIHGFMGRTVSECIHASVLVRLSDRNGNIIYTGLGKNAGLEMVQ